MGKKMNLTEATYMIMEELDIPDGLRNFTDYYRPLLGEVNKGNIPSEKKGRKNLVTHNDIEIYIQKLKKNGRYEHTAAGKQPASNAKDQVALKSSIEALLTLYRNNIYSSEKTVKEIIKIVES